MMSTLAPPSLFGREPELRVLEELLGDVAERGGALVVRGEAGIGKSSLLLHATELALANELTVLAATGVESEARLPFAGLHQLLHPCLTQIDELPVPQRDAISTAFGLTDAAAPDVFLIALASLELLGEAAARSPLLLVVDDAHWLDQPSADVLAFVARRIELEPIVMLVAVREGFDDRFQEIRLPELRLEGLDDDEAARVLDTNAPDLDSHLHTRLLAEAAGNPLALVELPLALRTEHLGDALLLSEPLPLTARLERAFAARSSELPESTRTLLVVAATDDGGALSEVLSAGSLLADTPLTVEELAPAISKQLVHVTAGRVQFRHPLVRSAICQAASVQERHAAHAALAEVLADAGDRGLWHRAASILGSDEGVSAELEDAAARALRRGAPAVAASALEHAARLTADTSRRGTLLLRAAEMEFELGRTDSSVRLLHEAEPLELGAHERIRWSFLLEMFEHGSWSGASRVESFVEIANQLTAEGNREHALEALLMVALRCWWGNPDDETRAAVVAAAERIGLPDDHPGLLAVLAFADPVNRGRFVVDTVRQTTPDPADTTGALLVGSAAAAVWAHDLSLPFLEIAVEGLRAQGRLGLLAQALVTQAWTAVHLAREPLAAAAAEEAARLARETRQPRWEAAAVLAQATVAAERGDFDRAEALVEEAELVLVPMGASSMLALAQFVRGRGAVAHQRYSEGLEHLRRIVDPADPVYQPFVGAWALSDLVEAAALSGAEELAREYLETLETLAEKTTGPLLLAQAGYARPLVAGDDEAEAFYQAALERDLRDWPCYRGRMLLWYGRWLRRRRRVAESRAPIRAARELFDALNLPELAESARQELRASGETSRRRVPEARDQLTPQELQIARMAAQGLSNREIGQRLYLSHRTIGSHLYRTFPKLGVTSRAQLSSVLGAESQSRQLALQSSD